MIDELSDQVYTLSYLVVLLICQKPEITALFVKNMGPSYFRFNSTVYCPRNRECRITSSKLLNVATGHKEKPHRPEHVALLSTFSSLWAAFLGPLLFRTC